MIINSLNEKIKKLENEKLETVKKNDIAIFKAVTRSEEILIDLNYARRANCELEKKNKECQQEIMKLKQENYKFEKTIHLKSASLHKRAKSEATINEKKLIYNFKAFLGIFKQLCEEEISKYSKDLNDTHNKINEKFQILIQSNSIPKRKSYEKDFSNFSIITNNIKILPIEMNPDINNLISILEYNKILTHKSSTNNLNNLIIELIEIKENLDIICPSEEEPFIKNLSNFIIKAKKNLASQTKKLEESVKEIQCQLAIEKYKNKQVAEEIEKYKGYEGVLNQIKALFGDKFAGDIVETIKSYLESRVLQSENSIISGELIYSPEEEFDMIIDANSLKTALEKNELSDINESKNSAILELKQ